MLIAPLLAAIAFFKAAPIVINADIAEGEVISHERTIKVRVQTDSMVTQVELYVNDDLRDSATATPYTFKIDPLSEKDGDLKLTFAAYTNAGENSKKTIHVKINSGVSKGAPALTESALDLVTQGKYDQAVELARVALKADPNYNPARMVLARAFLGLGAFDKAQQFAEDAQKADPKLVEATSLLSAIMMEKAFHTYNTGDRVATLSAIASALKTAVIDRQKLVEAAFDKIGKPTDENRFKYADAAIRAQHYSAAATALQPGFRVNPTPEAGDRIAFAQMRLGRYPEALDTIGIMKRANKQDAYGEALEAVLRQNADDEQGADDAIKAAIGDDPQNLGVRLAQVYVAIHRSDMSVTTRLLANLQSDQSQLPEVNYYVAMISDRLHRYDASDQAFQEGVLAEPLNYDLYLERGNEDLAVIATKKGLDKTRVDSRMLSAKAYFEAAQVAKPDSPQVLTALTILAVQEGDANKAADYADAAIKAGPTYPAAREVAAAVFSRISVILGARADATRKAASGSIDADVQKKIDEQLAASRAADQRARQENDMAAKLDPKNLGGTNIPDIPTAFRYFYGHGQIPVITAPK